MASARLLFKHPGFTVTAVCVLTLGIGVNAGVFGIINGLMIRPLAGADAPGEVVGVFSKDRTGRARLSPLLLSGLQRCARRGRTVRAPRRSHCRSRRRHREQHHLRVQSYTVTSDYFKTLGLRMVQGREFTAAEEATVGGTTPVIVDVTLAERLFANENPVGQLLQYGADSGTADSRPMVIVGLAPAVKHDLFRNRPEAHIYVPSGAADATRMFVYARAATPQTGDTIVRSVREQLRASDPNLPVIFVKSFRAQHEGSAQVWVLRTAAKMFLTLGLAGTFVAVIGLYGVRSYLVSRRIREFGVRMAIGASPADVLRLVLRESLAITTVGLTIGLGLAMLLGWGLRVAIYQISPLDPVALGASTGILAIASLAASIIPARRAANVLPMTALRNG